MRCRRPVQSVVLLVGCLLLGACLPYLPRDSSPPAGTYRVSTAIRYQLVERDFLVHLPAGYVGSGPLPLVVVLHGAFSTAAQTETESGFSRLADSERFLVAYPEGVGLFGWLQHWNAGHCCGKAAADGLDDVGFVAEVIAEVQRRLAVDAQRIYLVGMSNGGMLAYRYAAERGEGLAGVAVVAGALGSTVDGVAGWTMPPAQAPLPFIALHGLADDLVPVGGGASPARSERSYLPLTAALDYWRRVNGCAAEPQSETLLGGVIRRQRWSDCASAQPIEIDLIDGWGHRWPTPFFTAPLPTKNPLRGFDGSARIWAFFQESSRKLKK